MLSGREAASQNSNAGSSGGRSKYRVIANGRRQPQITCPV
jgi:hypothetical protein